MKSQFSAHVPSLWVDDDGLVVEYVEPVSTSRGPVGAGIKWRVVVNAVAAGASALALAIGPSAAAQTWSSPSPANSQSTHAEEPVIAVPEWDMLPPGYIARLAKKLKTAPVTIEDPGIADPEPLF